MKLRAKIVDISKYEPNAAFDPDADPKWVEIIHDIEDTDGYFIFYYDCNGNLIMDLWGLTIGDAKAQAEDEFGITENEWYEVDDNDDLRNQNK